MVIGDSAIGIVGINTSVTRSNITTFNDNVILSVVGTHIMDTEITARDRTVTNRHAVGNLRGSSGTADTTAGRRGTMGIVRRDVTSVEQDVGTSITAKHHASGCRSIVVRLKGQVLECVIVHIHKRHGTEDIGTRICPVVRDNHRVHIVTLESDGVHRGLSDIHGVKHEVRIGTRAEVEGHRASQTAIIQRLLNGGDVNKVGVSTPHRVVSAHQAVAGIGRHRHGVIIMETIDLTVSSKHKNLHIVKAMVRRKGSH